jgi:hypothetical protein
MEQCRSLEARRPSTGAAIPHAQFSPQFAHLAPSNTLPLLPFPRLINTAHSLSYALPSTSVLLSSYHLRLGLLSGVVSLCRLKQRLSLHKDTTPPQPNHTVTPTHIEPEQYNTWNKSTVSRKFLKMDVLTFETCWAVNSEIKKQVTSSWFVFIQLSRWCTVR